MKNILLTGASGFLGKILSDNLRDFSIISLSRTNATYITNLSTEVPAISDIVDIVIHAAGKAHSIPQSKANEEEFYKVNVKGTLNLLKGLENRVPKSFVYISSVAVYGLTSGINITEKHDLKAKDPYGRSKIEAECIVAEWCKKNNVICSILRLPLIAGPNPPGNLGDMIKAIKKGYYATIGGGTAKKSIVLAEDIAQIIPKALEVGGIYNLTDGYNPSFMEISKLIGKQLKRKQILNIPIWLAKGASKFGDIIGPKAPINSIKLSKIISDLTFDDSKAKKILMWNPTPVLKGFKVTE